MSKFFTFLRITQALLLIVYLSDQSILAKSAPKEQNQPKDTRTQTLGTLNQVLKQTNDMKLDKMVDDKMITNLTIAFNEMALNFRKMLGENKRLSTQTQEVMHRLQNVTGINVNSTIKNLQQQATNTNMSLANLNINNLIPRIGQ